MFWGWGGRNWRFMNMADVKSKRVFISVNDPSADAHCAGLVTALKQTGAPMEFVGIGGPKMAAAGCELLESTVGKSVMAYNVVAHLGHYYRLVRRVRRYLRDHPIDLMIVCDSPSFNVHVAEAAKKADVKTLFYVAPQLWAWGGWRIHRLRRLCDKLCCILPFEESWFRERGVDTVFVGNPLLDKLPSDLSGRRKDYSRFEPANARVALMPGSRSAEIGTLWRPMQEIAGRLQQKYPGMRFVVVAASEERRRLLEQSQIPGFTCEYSVDTVRDTAAAVDFSIVASGSATLEVASSGSPMVIIYHTNPVIWHLVGRWIVHPKFFTLVNLLANRRLVPEFMPYFTSIAPIVRTVEEYLANRDLLVRTSNELIDMVEPIAGKNAGEEAARVVLKMLG